MKYSLKKTGKVKNHEAHTAPTKFGMGDYSGTGSKQPMGKVRGDTTGFSPVAPSKLGKPPKSLA